MGELGKNIQKSIDNIVHENIYKLKLISKKSDKNRSNSFIRSGKKKLKNKKNMKKNISTVNFDGDFKPVNTNTQIQNFSQFNNSKIKTGKQKPNF